MTPLLRKLLPRVQPTAANFYLLKFCELAEQRGLDAEYMLGQLGIDPELKDTLDARIPADELGRIVQYICDATGDESMGIAAQPIPRGAFYAMTKIAILEPNLQRSILAATRFMQLISHLAAPQIHRRGGHIQFRFKFADLEHDTHHLLAELVLMSWHRLACWLIASNIPQTTVYFEYDEPQQIGEYDYLFPGAKRFGTAWSGFAFEQKFFDLPVKRDYDALQAFMRNNPVELFLQPNLDFCLAADIERLFKRQLYNQPFPTIEEAARSVHISRRTLIRRLKNDGTSYQTIKDRVRREQATTLLAAHGSTISEIAESVGFADAAAFSRAFKLWTGQSPSEYRNELD